MQLTTHMYFRQIWLDKRLAGKTPEENHLILSRDMVDDIWTPDTFFGEARDAKFHNVPTPNIFVRLQANGTIMKSIKVSVTTPCKPNLVPGANFTCHLDIESYGWSTKDIAYNWAKGNASAGMSKEISIHDFSVTGISSSIKQVNLSSGNYSIAEVDFKFQRDAHLSHWQIWDQGSTPVLAVPHCGHQ